MKSMEVMKIRCPGCGHEAPVWYGPEAECRGIQLKCKKCKKEFRPVIRNGMQIQQ